MKKLFLICYLSCLFSCENNKEISEFDFTTTFEKTDGLETATYTETIAFYTALSEAYNSIAMYEMGKTDHGEPLHLITFNPNRTFESEFSDREEKNILLINNGIHPGESDGIDASMLLLRDFAVGKLTAPKNTIIAVIPIYNIGGAINRNSSTRTNQNGPKSYGFRGNARNYDLNRDFIKNDTRNAQAFVELFRTVKPDLFIDNHVSNGADYQYTLTHLFTQHNKLGGGLGHYLHTSLMPQLEDSLKQKSWDITPYVNVFNQPPDEGFSQFLDSPRYSTGYTTLFNTLGMMVETHMLKPYKQRVEGTYELMKSFINIVDKDVEVIGALRKNAIASFKPGSAYPLSWNLDSTQVTKISFKGFESEMIKSNVTNASRLKYYRDRPFTKEVAYYNYFKAKDSVIIPAAYVIPSGYWNIVQILRNNGIRVPMMEKDSIVDAEVYKIKNYETVRNPYEGHYLHYNTQVTSIFEKITVKAGDYLVDTNQDGVRYILETLEPIAPDSFFNWNFFDAILQQKEGFSPYVWEDMAEAFLNDNPQIKAEFDAKIAEDPNFAGNWYAQLDWIHKQSPYYESSHLRYPIVRVGG